MTIDELISLLKTAKPDVRVYFSFCKCIPDGIGSWRGSYDEPALGWAPSGYSGEVDSYPTVKSLIEDLEDAINGVAFSGWKGGEYCYHGHETLHIDNDGDCTNTEISRVEIKDWEVIIHT